MRISGDKKKHTHTQKHEQQQARDKLRETKNAFWFLSVLISGHKKKTFCFLSVLSSRDRKQHTTSRESDRTLSAEPRHCKAAPWARGGRWPVGAGAGKKKPVTCAIAIQSSSSPPAVFSIRYTVPARRWRGVRTEWQTSVLAKVIV